MGHFATVPPAAISRVLASFERHELVGFISVAIDLLDLTDGDLDLEEDDPPEEAGDHEDAAWIEREDQRRIAVGGLHGSDIPGISEDAEVDDEDCGQDEAEPDFRKHRRYRRGESGPGCVISDSDYGGALL